MITYTVTVDEDKTKRWYLKGKFHREDGPAVEWANGSKYWYLNDKLHREDGPAVERADGTKHWYLNGDRLTQAEFNSKIKKEVAYVQPNIMSLANKIEKETLKGLSENDIISVCETIIENVYRNMRK
jgi:hypothetical protein